MWGRSIPTVTLTFQVFTLFLSQLPNAASGATGKAVGRTLLTFYFCAVERSFIKSSRLIPISFASSSASSIVILSCSLFRHLQIFSLGYPASFRNALPFNSSIASMISLALAISFPFCYKAYIVSGMIHMIDLLHLRIPLKAEFLSLASDGSRFCDLNYFSKHDGLILNNQSTHENGELVKLYEGHKFESLPSSYTGVACCLRASGHVSFPEPYLEVKFSPAKILQGHNVFGPDTVQLGFLECLAVITTHWPKLASALDVFHADVLQLDVTYSVYFESPSMVHQAKIALESARSRTNSRAPTIFQSTVMFDKCSSYAVKKVYEKGPEVENQINEITKKLKSDPENVALKNTLSSLKSVLSYSTHLLRFEAGIKKRYLEKFGISSRIRDLIRNEKTTPEIYQFLWSKSFEQILKSLEGQKMTTLDETQICKSIDNKFITYTTEGRQQTRKARAVRSFFFEVKNRGLVAVKDSMAPRTFYDNMNALKSIGLSSAVIRSLNSNTQNVIPMTRILNIDFSKQYPTDYIQPKLLMASGLERFL